MAEEFGATVQDGGGFRKRKVFRVVAKSRYVTLGVKAETLVCLRGADRHGVSGDALLLRAREAGRRAWVWAA
jgi:hypothetical protein